MRLRNNMVGGTVFLALMSGAGWGVVHGTLNRPMARTDRPMVARSSVDLAMPAHIVARPSSGQHATGETPWALKPPANFSWTGEQR